MYTFKKLTLCAVALQLIAAPVIAGDLTKRKDVQGFIKTMQDKHGFAQESLTKWFTQTRIQPSIIKAISRPAEKKPWHVYRKIFLTESRIDGGVEFWNRHADLLKRAQTQYGIDPEIIVGIIGVETRYGRHKGSYRVIDALTTLGFDYPPRSKFFRSELEHYLLMTREEKVDPMSLKGSYAGAMGQPQFISSSYRSYAIDFDNDGKRDIWDNPADAIGSVANYLARHGWQRGKSITHRVEATATTAPSLLKETTLKPTHTIASLKNKGMGKIDPDLDANARAAMINLDAGSVQEHWLGLDNFYAITRYNHSALYAMAVYQLAQEIRQRRDNPTS